MTGVPERGHPAACSGRFPCAFCKVLSLSHSLLRSCFHAVSASEIELHTVDQPPFLATELLRIPRSMC